MIRGTITYQGSPDHTLSVLKKVVKDGLFFVGDYWHKKILRRHFEDSAVSRYGYKKRSKKHQRRKMRKFGHERPLEFTGRLKREVTRRARIVNTSKRVRVHLKGPEYLWAYRKDYGQPDKAAELTATTLAEAKEMAEVLKRVTTRGLRSRPKRMRRVVRM